MAACEAIIRVMAGKYDGISGAGVALRRILEVPILHMKNLEAGAEQKRNTLRSCLWITATTYEDMK